MASLQEEDMSKTKLLMFDGNQQKWREWSRKFMARARLGHWSKILEGTESVPAENLDENILLDEQKRARKLNDEAYNVLILCCEGSAFNCVERAVTTSLPHGDAVLAWKNLKEQYVDD